VQAVFAQEEKACYARFSVTQCVDRAKSRRNDALADLRRQELSLNESDRKRKAAERLQEMDERNAPEKQQAAAERRAKALAQQKEREDRMAAKKAKREAQLQQPTPQPRKADAPKTMEPGEAARNREAYEEKVRDAEARKARIQDRAAHRKKPAASDLLPPR
jgi:colicin import membrane protein